MIEIKIPLKTPSVNHLYGQRGFRKFLKPEAKTIRKLISEVVTQRKPFSEEAKLEVHTMIHEDWYTKKGTIKRKDCANREKFLTDSVFEALGLDDKQVFRHIIEKD